MTELVDCKVCVYGYTCSQPKEEGRPRDDCLTAPDGEAFPFRHFVRGDPAVRLLELQRSGAINIVIGGQGEHEVNANWSIREAHKQLFDRCCDVGGLVVKEGTLQLYLMKPYGPSFVLEWMHDKLYKISIRQHRIWWEAE